MLYYGYEEGSYSLAHYGIAGMKWKNRRARRLQYIRDKERDYRSNHSYIHNELKSNRREEIRNQAYRDASDKRKKEEERLHGRRRKYM